jgi:DNA polymerase-1
MTNAIDSHEHDIMSNRPILIIDGMNAFIRAWSVHPNMSVHGYQMGGTVGFLKTLGKLCKDIKPSRVIVVWEGGGSSKRRAIYPEYKMNRRPEKLNRFYDEEDIPNTEENKVYQIKILIQLMKFIPIIQVYAQNCEGDDVIAYLIRDKYKNINKIIASSDKDMYQLLDVPYTKIYNLHKKIFIDKDKVYQEYNVIAENFAFAKSLCGDPSDNIPGIKGMGYKTLVKRLPFIGVEYDVTLDKIFDYCEAHKSESRIYKRILENRDIIKRNFKLIYLHDHILSLEQSKKVDYQIDNFEPKTEKLQFLQILAREGLNNYDPTWLFYALNGVN